MPPESKLIKLFRALGFTECNEKGMPMGPGELHWKTGLKDVAGKCDIGADMAAMSYIPEPSVVIWTKALEDITFIRDEANEYWLAEKVVRLCEHGFKEIVVA